MKNIQAIILTGLAIHFLRGCLSVLFGAQQNVLKPIVFSFDGNDNDDYHDEFKIKCYGIPFFFSHFSCRFLPPLLCNLNLITVNTLRTFLIDLMPQCTYFCT